MLETTLFHRPATKCLRRRDKFRSPRWLPAVFEDLEVGARI